MNRRGFIWGVSSLLAWFGCSKSFVASPAQSVVKAAPGALHGYSITNHSKEAVYLRLYNSSRLPDPSRPMAVVGVPAGMKVKDVFVGDSSDHDLLFDKGVSYVITRNVDDESLDLANGCCELDMEVR
jgi:hypothetical protein